MRAKLVLSLATLPLRNAYVFVLVVLVAFMQAGFHIGHRDNTLLVPPKIQDDLLQPLTDALHNTISTRRGVINEHPIPRLMEDAEARYRKKLGGQSKTLKNAVAEYRKRYKRAPPKGFDAWWKFTQRHDVKFVDEYDGLMQDLAPFWQLSGAELKQRATQAGQLPWVDLVRVKGGVAEAVNLQGQGVSGRAEGFRAMLDKFQDTLPYLEFPINAHSENRVLVSWAHLNYPNLTVQDSSGGLSSMLGGPFKPDWNDDENTWDKWRRTCHPDSNARRIFSSLRSPFRQQAMNYFDPGGSPGEDFTFSSGPISTTVDFCDHPQAHHEQGHFFSDFRPIEALYPIFSPAKAQGFMDIRIPSHYYFGNTPRYTYGWDSVNLEMKDVDAMEVPWEMKQDKIFWRGASTGGGNHPPGLAPHFHRHRFLQMASDGSESNRTVTFADPANSDHFVAASIPVSQLNDEVMDVVFVKALSAEGYPGGEAALRREHRFADAVSLGRHWAYKYLLDLDGAGYSAKFMAFLASDSVPVKATVYKEYYLDWIEPWLHFIPISSTYQEVYNIQAYFSGPTEAAVRALGASGIDAGARRSKEGDMRLRRIARAGKQWKQTVGRHIDMEVYVYRLCLEWARLTSEDRSSMDYS